MRYNTVYFVSASSYLLGKIFLTELKKNISSNHPKTSISVEMYYYDEIGLAQILESLQTPSLFSEYKIIVLKNVDKLSDEDKGIIKKYCEVQNKLFPLVLFITNDIENELKKEFNKLAKFINLETNAPQLLKQYVLLLLKQRAKKITVDALNIFLEYNRDNIDLAEAELEKLVDYTEGKNTITSDDVCLVCFNNSEQNIFKLVDLVSAKNKSEVFLVARDFLTSEQYPGYILAVLSSHLTKIYRIKKMQELGYGKDEIQKKLDILSYRYYNNLFNQANYFDIQELEKKIKLLVETDRLAKTSSLENSDIVEVTLAKLCL